MQDKRLWSFFQANKEITADQRTLSAIAAVLWTGLVTVAYTIYAQSFGQARVSPTDSNIIYTIQPICTAAFAWALLGETLGIEELLGGFLIGIAVYTVATNDSNGDPWD
jgi:drug/metabolite transporter (DMT)-like permease